MMNDPSKRETIQNIVLSTENLAITIKSKLLKNEIHKLI